MNSRIIWLWIASVLSALLTGVAGKECTSEDNSYTISSPEDVIKYFDGCTTINSDRIIIRNTYEGPFVLPTVTKITGTIRCEYNSGMTRPAVIPALEAPDLLYLGALEIQEADSLTNISFPQLETVAGGISIGSTAEYVHTSFPALTESGSLSIRARFSNLNFPSLTKVRNDLTVDFCPSCPPPFAKRSVSFPSLQSAGYVRLVGAITSIDMPLLASVGPPTGGDGRSTDSGIEVHLYPENTRGTITLPKLSLVDKQLYIDGGVTYLFMPSFQSTTAHIHVNTTRSLTVESSLVNASAIELLGEVFSVQLNHLTHVSSLTIDSTLDCGTIQHNLTDSYYRFRCAWPPLLGPIGKAVVTLFCAVFACLAYIYFAANRNRRAQLVYTPLRSEFYTPRRPGDFPRHSIPRERTPPPPYSETAP